MMVSRRSFVAGASAAAVLAPMVRGSTAFAAPLPITVAVRSPWEASQIAVTSKNVLFLGLPRRDPKLETHHSLVRREPNGSLAPFPGNSWNTWKLGEDGHDAFVYLNSVHVFADDTVWCVDTGAPGGNGGKPLFQPKPGAQKLVQLDPASGKVLQVVRFGDDILPPDSVLNDLRFHGSTIYMTESGVGALLVHDMSTGKTRRLLSGYKELMGSVVPLPAILQRPPGAPPFIPPNADIIEITADGAWLYWSSPTGPLYRIDTKSLNDTSLTDAQLATRIQRVADMEFSSGSAMDSRGNFYFAETGSEHITVMSPSGQKAILVSDPAIIRPDGMFISADRRLYIPVKTPLKAGAPGAPADVEKAPFASYSVALPESFDGIPLGGAVTGKA